MQIIWLQAWAPNSHDTFSLQIVSDKPSFCLCFIFIWVLLTCNVTLLLGIHHNDSMRLHIMLCSPPVWLPSVSAQRYHTPLSLFPVLFLSFLWLTLFITGSLCLPLPFTHFVHSLFPSSNYQFILCIYKSNSAFSVCLLWFLDDSSF